MRVRWTTPAREQFVSAYEYIAEENRAAAARTADQIWESTQLLAGHPMAGRKGRVAGTRELVISGTPFVVAYGIERNEVRILAVLHAAREWPEEFE
jgi:toxin ParE1/3/4